MFFVPNYFHNHQGRRDVTVQPNIQQILTDCIERGITNALRSRDIESFDLVSDIEHRIWIEIDSFFTFTES